MVSLPLPQFEPTTSAPASARPRGRDTVTPMTVKNPRGVGSKVMVAIDRQLRRDVPGRLHGEHRLAEVGHGLDADQVGPGFREADLALEARQISSRAVSPYGFEHFPVGPTDPET